MLGISLTDWLVIVVYLFGITFIGSLAARRVTSSASLFMGDRKFGKVMMIFFGFGPCCYEAANDRTEERKNWRWYR